MRSRFGWCAGIVQSVSQHSKCRRAYTNKRGLLYMCGCDRDGCACAVMNYHFPDEETNDNGDPSS